MKIPALAVAWTALAIAAMAASAEAQRAPVRHVATASALTTSGAADRQSAMATLNNLPVRFEPTAHKDVFLARGMSRTVQLSGTSIDFPRGSGSRGTDSIRREFAGARKSSG